MKRVFLTMASVTALFLAGCSDDLTPERTDKPPGVYAPDPASHLPAPSQEANMPRI